MDAQGRTGRVLLGVAAAGIVAWIPAPEGLSDAAWGTAAVATLMAAWWVLEALPLAVTALVPLVALPLVTGRPMGEIAGAYAHPLLWLMFGGFVLGHAMERVALHTRLTAWLLRPAWVRHSPRRVVLALMVVTAALSGLVSNTATTLMVLPIGLALARTCRMAEGDVPAFALAIAYSASLGGLATLVGTPPNAVLAGMAPTLAGVEVGFARWMGVGLPAVVVLLPIAWWVVTAVAWRLPRRFAAPLDAPAMPAARPGEGIVVAVAGLALLAWLTRAPKDLGGVVLPGWSGWVSGKGSELDAAVALVAALALFLASVRDEHGGWRPLLIWKEAQAALPWSVLLLLGGGFCLAGAIESTGLTAWIASGSGALEGLPLPLTTLGLSLVTTFVTELTSNTATATVSVPLIAQAAEAVGVPAMAWLVPATLSASCAFMMPVATMPNAIASEAGGVATRDMLRAGLVLNVVGAVVVTVLSLLLVPWVFPPA